MTVRVIIDNDTVRVVLPEVTNAEYQPVFDCLFGEGRVTAKLVYGGHLRVEYERSADLRRTLRVLDAAGRTAVMKDEQVNAEQMLVEALGMCKANDTHIIALARVSKTRLLCTNDNKLMADFHNKTLIDAPRGKVYLSASHAFLLTRLSEAE